MTQTGTELATTRRQLGLTQAQLATLAGIGRTTVADVESGLSGIGTPSHQATVHALDHAKDLLRGRQ